MRKAKSLLLSMILLATVGSAGAEVLDVFPDGSGPCASIQQALLAVQPGDTISLANGTFVGPANRNLILGDALTLRSTSGDPADCTIDIQQQGRAFFIYCAPGTSILIEGITLRGGDSRFLPEPEMPGYGGAVFAEGVALGGLIQFTNCILAENRADAGGAAFLYRCGASFRTSTIRDNLATDGAGIYCGSSNSFGDVDFSECVFHGNNYPDPTVGGYGTGIYFSRSSGTVESCTFVDNRAWLGAGMLVSTDSAVQVQRSIIAFNPEGQGLATHNGTAQVGYCDIFGNAGGDWVGAISDQLGNDCNISADPLFCSATTGDFSLSADSPCLAENSAGCGLIGALPLDCSASSTATDGSPGSSGSAFLAQAFPNPFNPATSIAFFLTEPGPVRLRVFDMTGRCVTTLAAGETPSGHHRQTWSGCDETGRQVAAGVYFYRMEAGEFVETRRMTLLK